MRPVGAVRTVRTVVAVVAVVAGRRRRARDMEQEDDELRDGENLPACRERERERERESTGGSRNTGGEMGTININIFLIFVSVMTGLAGNKEKRIF